MPSYPAFKWATATSRRICRERKLSSLKDDFVHLNGELSLVDRALDEAPRRTKMPSVPDQNAASRASDGQPSRTSPRPFRNGRSEGEIRLVITQTERNRGSLVKSLLILELHLSSVQF